MAHMYPSYTTSGLLMTAVEGADGMLFVEGHVREPLGDDGARVVIDALHDRLPNLLPDEAIAFGIACIRMGESAHAANAEYYRESS